MYKNYFFSFIHIFSLTSRKSHTIDLFDGDGTVGNTEGWNAGYKYIYNVTIGIEEITFTANVTAWDTDKDNDNTDDTTVEKNI